MGLFGSLFRKKKSAEIPSLDGEITYIDGERGMVTTYDKQALSFDLAVSSTNQTRGRPSLGLAVQSCSLILCVQRWGRISRTRGDHKECHVRSIVSFFD